MTMGFAVMGGESILCPRDGRPGTSYVDALVGPQLWVGGILMSSLTRTPDLNRDLNGLETVRCDT